MRRLLRGLLVAATVALAGLGAVVAFTPLPLWMVLQGGSQVGDHRHFDTMPIARAAVPSAVPAASAALRWPGGLDRAAAEADLAARGTLALLVARRGQLVYERYFNGHAADTVTTSFSMAKSVVSVLLGIAVDEGLVDDVDVPLTRWLPELRGNDPRFDRVTLRHLLAMRSGIAFDESYASPFSDVARLYLTDDLRREVARLRIAGAPDQGFAYHSVDTQLLAMVIERASGVPLARWTEQRLWQPMGAQHDASWSLDSTAGSVARAFCCLNARAIDVLRFGLVVAGDGSWHGRRIVSRDWLRRSTAAQQDLPGAAEAARRNIERIGTAQAAFYGWQWRIRPLPDVAPLQPGTRFYAQGLHGQILLVDRDAQTVVLRLGRGQGGRHWPTWIDELARLNAD